MSNPMDCSTLGFRVLHHLLEYSQTHVYWGSDAISPFHAVVPFPSCFQSFPTSGSISTGWLFTGGQSIAASASAPVLPMNTWSSHSFVFGQKNWWCAAYPAWWGFGCRLRRDWGRLLRKSVSAERETVKLRVSTNKNMLRLTQGTLLNTL